MGHIIYSCPYSDDTERFAKTYSGVVSAVQVHTVETLSVLPRRSLQRRAQYRPRQMRELFHCRMHIGSVYTDGYKRFMARRSVPVLQAGHTAIRVPRQRTKRRPAG